MGAEKAVVLLSGGLDSTVCMSVAASRGFELWPLSFDYRQRHRRELLSARRVAERYGVKRHLLIETNMNAIGGSALTDASIDVPAGDASRADTPATYVPARNLIFLGYAFAYAEVIGATHVYIGVNSVDFSNYPDCRPEFIAAFARAARLGMANGGGIVLETPLQHLGKGDIVRLGVANGAPLELSYTCYRGGERACGTCDGCLLRLRGFAEAGLTDPIAYEQGHEPTHR